MKKSVFETLNAIDCSAHTEKKNNLTYLSWCWAIAEVQKRYPDMTYEVKKWDDKPYLYDAALGYMVETCVTIQGESKSMWLPVMDSANKAQKAEDYIITKRTRDGKTCDQTVLAATMFDINTAIMRCLVKNLAMFGLGLYIYAGEDLPEEIKEQRDAEIRTRAAKEQEKRKADALNEVKEAKTTEEVKALWAKYPDLHIYPAFKEEIANKGKTLREQEEKAQ